MIIRHLTVTVGAAVLLLLAGCGGTPATSLATPAPPRPPVDSAQPFVELLIRDGGIVDYQPDADPAEALDGAAHVFAGTVVGLAGFTEPVSDGGRSAERYVVLEVQVLEVIKGDPGDPAYIGIPASSAINQTTVRATIPYGAKIAVRTMADTADSDPGAAPATQTILPVLIEGLFLQGTKDKAIVGGHMGEASCPQWLKTCTVDAYADAMMAAR
ncbi:hypothetical protein [Microlunatus speluncae]|uniref:hypothetical protein n=1 Tax=Microlunatus speluncae TaxID=2594267 RepID=UPI0012666A4C|nr:hypothetical protein [Microlunatus speluncae]